MRGFLLRELAAQLAAATGVSLKVFPGHSDTGIKNLRSLRSDGSGIETDHDSFATTTRTIDAAPTRCA
jgi:hypothetical protein